MIGYLEDFDLKIVSETDPTANILVPSQEEPTKVFLVMVMANWCGHCKQTEPKYKQLADEVEGDPSIQVCIAETTGDRKSEQAIAAKTKKFFPQFKGFPHICMYKAGKFVKNYEGNRSVQDLKAFCGAAQNA